MVTDIIIQTNASRIDHIVAEHGGKSLDELVLLKIINTDQKAAYLKKPQLEAQLFHLEEQLAQHKKVAQEFKARLAEQEKALTDKFEKEKADLVTQLTEKADADAKTNLHDNLLILSQFLRLAAARRAEDADSTSDESMALEGVLLHVYTGDENAVSAMLKLVQGAEEPTRSTTGETLQTTCKCAAQFLFGQPVLTLFPVAQVKQLAIAHAAPFTQTEASQPAEADIVDSQQEAQPDPTVANAGLTEVEEGSATALTNGHVQEPSSSSAGQSGLSNADVDDSAANAAGESQWDTGNDAPLSQEWVDVKVPREPSETETGIDATPAAPANTQSWADDHPETETPAADDGFQSVQGRNRGHRENGWRGRGGYRGRGGFRGEGRGRGRGGQRGGFPSRPRRGGEPQQQQ
jgi:uncharacterized coiled-coil protein SlyX